VFNYTGTNGGDPYIDVHTPLPPLGFLDVLVQYYVPNPRSVPKPLLIAEPLPFVLPTVNPPMLTLADKVDAGLVIQFMTASSRLYCVQSSRDFVQWNTLPGLLTGTGGALKCTNSLSGDQRFFRVLLLP
jgi:hypothetical protein